MPVKVSVIVPVYNPGANIDDLLRSLVEQSLPDDSYEAILVDDGSTDGTGERLDRWAARHPHMRVQHIPNSGWPGRPRNVGTDLARGDYVLYVDNDDWLDREALQRLHALAVADDADVVVGKVVGHGKNVARELFRRNRSGVDLDWPPLLRLLTPHKLFRRALLHEHGIRFPEGRQRLEDHVFVLRTYFCAAGRISILADHPIYHWVLRGGKNASWARMDARAYFRHDLPAVLDVIDAHTEPGERRDRLYAHWYRSKALWRVQGGAFARRDRDHNREIYAEVRRLVAERFGPELDAQLPLNFRVCAAFVRADRFEGLEALARYEAAQVAQLRLTARTPREAGGETLCVEGYLGGKGARLVLRRDGERLLWEPPEDLRPQLAGLDLNLDVTTEVAGGQADVLLRSVADRVEHVLPAERRTCLQPIHGDPARVTPVVVAELTLDAATAASGAPLAPGRWRLRVVLRAAGFNATDSVPRRGAGRQPPVEIEVAAPPTLRRRLAGIGPLRKAVRTMRGA